MAITINTNVMSLNAQRNLGKSQGSLANSMQRLSSGLRINSAKDDAAGLAISDRMTAQIRGLNQAARNANDGISLAQTAEGALQESTNILQRMRELAVQSANDTNSDSDRASLNDEVTQLKAELDRIAETSEFNGRKVIDGSLEDATFQVGANAGTNQTISFSITSALGKDLSQVGTSIEATVDGTAVRGSSVSGDAFATGDLVVNGKEVTANDGTAASLAAAINLANADGDSTVADIATAVNVQSFEFKDVSLSTTTVGTATEVPGSNDATAGTSTVAFGGAFDFSTVNSATISVDSGPDQVIDLTAVTSQPTLLTALNDGLTGATASVNEAGDLVITSATTGATSTVAAAFTADLDMTPAAGDIDETNGTGIAAGPATSGTLTIGTDAAGGVADGAVTDADFAAITSMSLEIDGNAVDFTAGGFSWANVTDEASFISELNTLGGAQAVDRRFSVAADANGDVAISSATTGAASTVSMLASTGVNISTGATTATAGTAPPATAGTAIIGTSAGTGAAGNVTDGQFANLSGMAMSVNGLGVDFSGMDWDAVSNAATFVQELNDVSDLNNVNRQFTASIDGNGDVRIQSDATGASSAVDITGFTAVAADLSNVANTTEYVGNGAADTAGTAVLGTDDGAGVAAGALTDANFGAITAMSLEIDGVAVDFTQNGFDGTQFDWADVTNEATFISELNALGANQDADRRFTVSTNVNNDVVIQSASTGATSSVDVVSTTGYVLGDGVDTTETAGTSQSGFAVIGTEAGTVAAGNVTDGQFANLSGMAMNVNGLAVDFTTMDWDAVSDTASFVTEMNTLSANQSADRRFTAAVDANTGDVTITSNSTANGSSVDITSSTTVPLDVSNAGNTTEVAGTAPPATAGQTIVGTVGGTAAGNITEAQFASLTSMAMTVDSNAVDFTDMDWGAVTNAATFVQELNDVSALQAANAQFTASIDGNGDVLIQSDTTGVASTVAITAMNGDGLVAATSTTETAGAAADAGSSGEAVLTLDGAGDLTDVSVFSVEINGTTLDVDVSGTTFGGTAGANGAALSDALNADTDFHAAATAAWTGGTTLTITSNSAGTTSTVDFIGMTAINDTGTATAVDGTDPVPTAGSAVINLTGVSAEEIGNINTIGLSVDGEAIDTSSIDFDTVSSGATLADALNTFGQSLGADAPAASFTAAWDAGTSTVTITSDTTGTDSLVELTAGASGLQTNGKYSLELDGQEVDMSSVVTDNLVSAADVASAINADTNVNADFAANVNSETGELEISRRNDSADFTLRETVDADADTVADDTVTPAVDAGLVGINSTESEALVGQISISTFSDATFEGDGFANSGLNTAGNATTTIDEISVATREDAWVAIESVDAALSDVDTIRGGLGAVQNRFESTIANLNNVAENLSAARSRILDADIAMETSAMTKNNILQQAGVSILAQANQAPQLALSLLG